MSKETVLYSDMECGVAMEINNQTDIDSSQIYTATLEGPHI